MSDTIEQINPIQSVPKKKIIKRTKKIIIDEPEIEIDSTNKPPAEVVDSPLIQIKPLQKQLSVSTPTPNTDGISDGGPNPINELVESVDTIGNISELKQLFDENKCGDPENNYNSECNKFLLRKEYLESEQIKLIPDDEATTSTVYLYPNLNDPSFNIKIAEKKEFNDTKYDGEIHRDDIEQYADILSKADFELAPHQAFVRNFLSFQTPYNSLLLYHGLGSGKTCSAIGVCEEMRDYLKQINVSSQIIIIASPNVQDNFKLQLFDERKLKLVNGQWNIRACTGNKLLKEINPMNMKGYTREKIISQIKHLISHSYVFMGYLEFANYIAKVGEVKGIFKTEREKKYKHEKMIRNLRREFNNRLIVIDEVHNIRISSNNENKIAAQEIMNLVSYADNIRLLLLSATPMYNTYKEIVWLLNLMNINDRRAYIEIKDIFDKDGNFKINQATGEKIGENLLIRKATGYISFVRGDNPYTFPFRIYPSVFSPERVFTGKGLEGNEYSPKYPRYQMNGKKITNLSKQEIMIMRNLYTIPIGSIQSLGYRIIIDSLRRKKISITTKTGTVKTMPSFENMDSFGYTLLQLPLESLNIVYPIMHIDHAVKHVIPIKDVSEILEMEDLDNSNEAGDESVDGDSDINNNDNIGMGPKKKKLVKSIEPETPVEPEVRKNIYEEVEELEEIKEIKENPTKENDEATEVNEDINVEDIYINPADLTGHKGLTRIMDFIDSKTPPEKGSFEYSAMAKKHKWNIFHPKQIGKYSSKIKNICDCIIPRNKEGEIKVSNDNCNGVILIYSQYIDGGLIPMALALEELGFTRFSGKSGNIKSLFKTPPTDPIDVVTMQPRKSKEEEFKPAKYIMITGDRRLSPNNDFDIKTVTDEKLNINGHKIKVVLISMAGSEGIDLKFVRQVHILEPWYNMNRLEQIIGRGVRNFSHKDLDFDKRNVQIFMYATLLDGEETEKEKRKEKREHRKKIEDDKKKKGKLVENMSDSDFHEIDDENTKEEAADLCVYRIATYKAVQIGKVSRVLKENAVDCIINSDQQNFTQENMKTNVRQILYDGTVIKDFKVGDEPYSPACDYMEKCGDVIVTDNLKINQDSYSEPFIMMNSDKILQKIRALMKERFFYKKDDLIQRIQIPKYYPKVQIYAALTQLIEDSTEFITDKYDRIGYLVNVGDYYLFQPGELNDNKISILDRSVPIPYKYPSIKFDVDISKKPIDIPVQIKETKESISNDVEEIASEALLPRLPSTASSEVSVIANTHIIQGVKLIKEIELNYNLVIQYSRENSDPIPRGDDNWYKHCGTSIKKLINAEIEQDKIPEPILLELVREHIIDMLTFDEKIILLNYLYDANNELVRDENSFVSQLKNYFENPQNQKIITSVNKKTRGIILYNENKMTVMVLKNNTAWMLAKPTEELELIEKSVQILAQPIMNVYSKFAGYIGYDKKGRYLVFKLMDTESKRKTGARCDESAKIRKIQVLNIIYGVDDKFNDVNTKGMIQPELCSLIELLLRYRNKIKLQNKTWYLDFETAQLLKF
jgi:hypothetical protein